MRNILLLATVLVIGGIAAGGETRIWDVSRRDSFARGEEFENLVLSSRGELRLGYASAAVEAKDEPSFWCGLALDDGSFLAGTGKGAIYRVAGGKAEKAGETKEMLVTSLVRSGDGVYAATIPNGKIFRQDGASWKEFATLESKYVWQLLPAPSGGVYAACGSPGAVFAVDSGGRATAVFAPSKDSPLKCENVLTIHADGDGLVAGTAAPGLLLRLAGGKTHVLYDFGEGEVKSIALHRDAWYVAVNSGVKAAPSEFLNAVEKAQEKKDDVQPKDPQGTPPAPAPQDPGLPSPPSGGGGGGATSAIWRMAAARTERVVEFATSYVTELAAADDGVYVGTNNSGRVFRLLADGDHELLFDFAEGQVLGFVKRDRAVAGALMGSRAALRTFSGERAKRGTYVSEVLDARFLTHWGTLSRIGSGAYRVETRSGNLAKAGEGWSDWQEPAGGKVASPKGRYLQFRVTIEDAAAQVRAVSIAYRNENQRPRVKDLKVESVPARSDGGFAPMSGERGPAPRLGEGHSLQKRIQWRGEDDDGDYTVFRIYYKPVDGGTWVPLLGKDTTPMFEHAWNTENVPDGKYFIRVVASDEKANPVDEALTGSADTDPFVIDNGKPEVEFSFAGANVSGTATDKASNITRIEWSVDGGEWHAAMPKDRLFDDVKEEFEFRLSGLESGSHTLTVRVLDHESNVGTLSKTFDVK